MSQLNLFLGIMSSESTRPEPHVEKSSEKRHESLTAGDRRQVAVWESCGFAHRHNGEEVTVIEDKGRAVIVVNDAGHRLNVRPKCLAPIAEVTA